MKKHYLYESAGLWWVQTPERKIPYLSKAAAVARNTSDDIQLIQTTKAKLDAKK